MNDTLSAHDKKIIKDRERRFRKADTRGKRCLIAKDVIRLVKEKKVVAHSMGYLIFDDKIERRIHKVSKDIELRDILGPSPSCTACAVGSMFVSAVLRNGDFKVYRASPVAYEIFGYLQNFFSYDQLKLIESAFETVSMDKSVAGSEAAAAFGEQYDEESELLVAVMQNVIKNKGVFIP